MTDKVKKIREEVERIQLDTQSEVLKQFLDYIDKVQKEPVSEDLEDASRNYADDEEYGDDIYFAIKAAFKEGANWQKEQDLIPSTELGNFIDKLSKQFPEVSFAKLSRIAVRVAKWQQEKEYTCYEEAFEDGAKWKAENLLKPADGDDLSEYDREVIVLTQPYPLESDDFAVSFAHRPNPDGWDGKSGTTDKVEHYTPKTYGKGGWNLPYVKYWLDVKLPKEIE